MSKSPWQYLHDTSNKTLPSSQIETMDVETGFFEEEDDLSS